MCVCLWQLLRQRSFEFTDWTVYRFCAKWSYRYIFLRTSSVEVLVVLPQAARSTDGVNRSLHINWGSIDRGTALLPWLRFVATVATYTLYCDGYCLHLLVLLLYPWCLSPQCCELLSVPNGFSLCENQEHNYLSSNILFLLLDLRMFLAALYLRRCAACVCLVLTQALRNHSICRLTSTDISVIQCQLLSWITCA